MKKNLSVNERAWVLITGASSGIGFALAEEFAKKGHSLVLSSRIDSELKMIAASMTATYDVNVETVAADLSTPDGPHNIYNFVEASGIDVEILVNNAGLGHLGTFWTVPLEKQISILRVNIEAVLRLTYLFLPKLMQKGHGRLLTTASIAGFEPGPTLAVYHASKAFILSFTEALATELENTGVTVTALCPGATDTDFFPKAHMTNTKAFQKGPVMAPQEVAEIAYAACLRGDRTVVPGGSNKALVFARRFMTAGAQAKLNKNMYEEVPPADRKSKRGDVELKKSVREHVVFS